MLVDKEQNEPNHETSMELQLNQGGMQKEVVDWYMGFNPFNLALFIYGLAKTQMVDQ